MSNKKLFLCGFLFLLILNVHAVVVDACSEEYYCDEGHHLFYVYLQDGNYFTTDNLIGIQGNYADYIYYSVPQSSDALYLFYVDDNYQEVLDSISKLPGFISFERVPHEIEFYDRQELLDTLKQNPETVFVIDLWSNSWFEKSYPGSEYFTMNYPGVEVVLDDGVGNFEVKVSDELELINLMDDLSIYSIEVIPDEQPISIIEHEQFNKFTINSVFDVYGREINSNSKTVQEFQDDNSMTPGVYFLKISNGNKNGVIRQDIK